VHKRQCSKNATQCSDQKNNNDNGCKTCVGKRREWRGVGKRVVLEGGSKISGGWDVGGANGNVDGEAGENGGSDSDAAYFGGQKI